jgi:hypothetical protein
MPHTLPVAELLGIAFFIKLHEKSGGVTDFGRLFWKTAGIKILKLLNIKRL